MAMLATKDRLSKFVRTYVFAKTYSKLFAVFALVCASFALIACSPRTNDAKLATADAVAALRSEIIRNEQLADKYDLFANSIDSAFQ